MARKIYTAQDYLMITLNKLFDYLKQNEKSFVRIVVALTDNNTHIVKQRAQKIHDTFQEEIENGLLHVISPSNNIYPRFKNNYLKASGQRLPYGNSIKRSNWQAKLSLDFAFLFSYCGQLQSDYFLNLEDDVIPINRTFFDDITSYIQEQNSNSPFWNSLIFSDWLSIGRLYRSQDLKKLVDMILIAYEKQPVDFIMHHFDVIQMADKFTEFRRKPSLLKHIGDVSTIEEDLSMKRKYIAKLNQWKRRNPPATLTTNITAWQGYTLDNAYFPSNKTGSYFWGRKYTKGDVIDITLDTISDIKSIRMLTGFGKDHERAGEDRLIEGSILIAEEETGALTPSDSTKGQSTGRNMKHSFCSKFSNINGHDISIGYGGVMEYKPSRKDARKILKRVKCIRFQINKGQSDWIMIRLIQIRV